MKVRIKSPKYWGGYLKRVAAFCPCCDTRDKRGYRRAVRREGKMTTTEDDEKWYEVPLMGDLNATGELIETNPRGPDLISLEELLAEPDEDADG